MGRWTQYDEDEYRLPEGMTRIGYDSDSGRYFFRDRNGVVWQGAEGAEFSEMTRVSSSASSNANEDDIEAAPSMRPDGYQPLTQDPSTNYPTNSDTRSGASPYRTLFPFFLMIAVVLLLIWRLVVSPIMLGPEPVSGGGSSACSVKGMKSYWVQPGDTCWEISRAHGCALDELKDANKALDCKLLMPGTTMCLPVPAGEEKAPVVRGKKRRL